MTSASRRRVMGAGVSLALAGCAPVSLWSAAPATLPGSHQADLRDGASGRTWRVWVQRPAGSPPSSGHPLWVVLDGNAAFLPAAQLARTAGSRPAELRADVPVVVGIGHASDAAIDPVERQRDYTPPAPGAVATADAGGADLLLDFIDRDVLPRVADGVAIDPRRHTLWGHSFSGLTVLHALFTRPARFTRYAAASPSVWWNGAKVLAAADTFAAAHAAVPRRFDAQLQMHVGSLETPEAATTPARAAVQRERLMRTRIVALGDTLTALRWPELRAHVTVVPGADHGSVVLPSLIDTLAFAQRAT